MGSRNNTKVPDFILMGLTESEEIQQVLFMLFLLMYLITLLGNAGVIVIIYSDLQFHTSMYFFLSQLSFIDLCSSTAITPKTLENLLTCNKYISYTGCFTQMYFFVFLCVTEFFLLSSMAYDRYVAIYYPLHYPIVMSRSLCYTLITGSYVIGFTNSLVIVLFMNSLHFCSSNVIYHFFCDLTPISALSCTDISDAEISIFILSCTTAMVSVITISVSYGSIFSTILKINSTSEKHKTFSTCASYLLGVTIFFITMSFTYLKPKRSYSLGRDQVASVFSIMVIPMLTPLIYSLRNKEVKNALIRIMQKRRGSRQFKCQ